MKYRNGFVSNSSTSSFIVLILPNEQRLHELIDLSMDGKELQWTEETENAMIKIHDLYKIM